MRSPVHKQALSAILWAMKREFDITLTPYEAATEDALRRIAAKKLSLAEDDITAIRFIRRSIDSRRREVRISARLAVYVGQEPEGPSTISFRDGDPRRDVVVVGAGPAGLFAALTLLEHGFRPIVLERGKDVHSRRLDTARLCRDGVLDEESNYAFGEGGAGAFSDGKLYTRSVKRGDVGKVLSLIVQHGAKAEILYDAHPHIGSDALPKVIENIRGTIVAHGGEVHFSTKVTSLVRESGRVVGVECADSSVFRGPIILATGHSAHDVYRFLKADGFTLEAKDLAVGVRLEHPQRLIDEMQYHSKEGRGLYLPAASYRFVTQVDSRGVYSFCMCPGGFIVPASTKAGELVVNGMSPASRAGRWANSGIVVQIRKEDVEGDDELAMLRFIRGIERRCFNPGYRAPAQRMTDFLRSRPSGTLPATSYIPGLAARPIDEVLPPLVAGSLRRGLEDFVRMTRGRFLSEEAVLAAPETRTSSPVRIVRGEDFSQVPGLYPCGEGAGYAGGIVSAALDGIAVAESIVRGADEIWMGKS